MALLGQGCVTKPANATGDSSTETGTVSSASESTKASDVISDLGAGSSSVEKVKVYQVQRGDNLWNIAAKPEVYGNGWLYPLLYKANADLLSHPDKLEKGFKLIVPRGQSATETEAAKEEAMASEYHHHPKLARASKAKPALVPTKAPTVASKPAAAEASKPLKPAVPAKRAGHALLWVFLILVLIGAGYAVYRWRQKPSE